MDNKKHRFMNFIYLFCLVEFFCTVLYTVGIKGVFNSTVNGDIRAFWTSMAFIIVNYLIWWIYAPISTYITEKIAKATLRDFKTDLCEHSVRLPMKYHDSKSSGDILSALTNDVRCLSDIYHGTIFQLLRSASGGIGGIIIMVVIDWRFAIIVFALGSCSVLISSYFSKRLETIGTEQQQRLAKTTTDMYELIRAAKTIRIFNLQKSKETAFEESAKAESDIKLKSGKINAIMKSALTTVDMVSYVAIIFVGALFVYYDLSDWGTVIALMALKGTADMLFVECVQFIAGMQGNIAGVKRLFEIIDTPKESMNDLIYEQSDTQYPLVINHLSFGYDEKSTVLSDFNLVLKRNGLTALLGESGSGKSTIMKLILGLYTPDAGQISFSSNEETYTNIRDYTAYVPQEPFLFRGTILENIQFGNLHATKDKIIMAAKMAGADEFITNLKDGYDTILVDNGKSLSGGQKQRIAIARALVKEAPILLLDEITSALDKDTEEHIFKTVKLTSQTRAVLFITHRPDVVNWADDVIYL
ncbi:ABC transporter ATP-binding protein [Paenibacillus sp. IHBB 10380]|uniref:ABC transporter ATP-binding protein n=1 Tax=Paenibacillus sp. IHBB 10380 TaxID=1566358 RepID=UPI001364A043|nr:ABC transporter ATP-binding protein [Paenibacillus sp. IHBB 10380]